MLDLMNYAYGAFGTIAVFVFGWASGDFYRTYKATAQERKLAKAAKLIAQFEAEKPDSTAIEAEERRLSDLDVRKRQLQARVAAL